MTMIEHRNYHEQILGQDATPHHTTGKQGESNHEQRRDEPGNSHEDEEGARGALGLVGVLLGLALLHREPTPPEINSSSKPN